MFFEILRKQLLLLWRNPMELVLLLGLPIVLIVILGNALAGWMNGETPEIKAKIALIEHEEEDQQLERFFIDVENSGLPTVVLEGLKPTVSQIAPVKILKESVLGNESLENVIQIENVPADNLKEVLLDKTYSAVIEVPENFSYETLNHIVFDEEKQATLHVYENEEQQIASSMVKEILSQFQEQLTLGTFIEKNGINHEVLEISEKDLPGEIMTINEKKSITAKDYYTVGMAVMNVLFLASALGSFAFREKKIYVFDRIVLANVSSWTYFSGILVSGTIFGFLQLLIIFGFSWVVFDVTWSNVFAFIAVTFFYALAVGGISVLLTAISYRFVSENVTTYFTAIIAQVMAFLGGSFFPIGDSSEFIQTIGNYTPNGAGMSAYLAILRGDVLFEIGDHLIFLILFSILTIIVAALTFPKRGVA